MKHFLAAFQFLTIIPVPGNRQPCREELEQSLPYYPLVGLIIGALLAIMDAGLRHFFPALLTSVILVITLLVVSGGLHCDGLADTADGFFSHRSPEQMLQIMKDSRTGPMGVMAIVAVFIFKIAAFASVAAPLRWWVLLLTPPAAYCALMLNIVLLPYVRKEGLGGMHAARRFSRCTWGAAALLLGGGWLAGGSFGLAAVAAALITGLFLALYTRRKIGGYTGDTLGAVYEIVSIMPALVAAAWGCGGMTI